MNTSHARSTVVGAEGAKISEAMAVRLQTARSKLTLKIQREIQEEEEVLTGRIKSSIDLYSWGEQE